MPRLPKWMKATVKDKTLPGSRPGPRGRPAPPIPSEEEFVSPLKAELHEIYATKQRVCTYHCTGCKYSTGGKCSLDVRAMEAVNTKDDPQPYLIEVRQELIATRNDNALLRSELVKTREDTNPQRRMQLLVGSGIAALVAKSVYDIFIQYVIPYLLMSIP